MGTALGGAARGRGVQAEAQRRASGVPAEVQRRPQGLAAEVERRPQGLAAEVQRRAQGLAAAAVAAAIAVGILASPVLAQGRPAADCQPFGSRPCLLPFPDDLFTRPDPTTATGLRVDLPAAALPVTTGGMRLLPGHYDQLDGFSPGSTLIVHVPGLDSPAALARTGAVGLLDMGAGSAPTQPIVVIDERTGQRQLIWTELDPSGVPPADTDLVIHPGTSFTTGDTYVVALRNLRTAAGAPIPAPLWFERLRDARPLPAAEIGQRSRYAQIFAVLKRAGIPRRSLYEAWDFTVGSTRSLTGRLLAIRNDAFAQLGDTNLADGVVQGRPPLFTITGTAPLSPGAHAVYGTFQVPCYLILCGPTATMGFHYASRATDALPSQIPGRVATVAFTCTVPNVATPLSPARLSLFGDGFLSTYQNVTRPNIQELAVGHDIVFCSTDQWGLAGGDVGFDDLAMTNLNLLPAMVDRMQQGALNMLYLGRLMINPAGLATDPAFQVGGSPIIDTSALYYDGNSTGGIQGGIVTAVSPDVRRAVLGVTGIDWANLLIPRTLGIGGFGVITLAQYGDQSLYPVVLDLMQQIWDRGDPDGYAQHMTTAPLPDTPSHTVLMQVAYGDKEVPIYAAMVEARTIGVEAHEPALDLSTDRSQDANLLYGIPPLPSTPYSGSAITVWDLGSDQVSPPPVASVPGSPLDTPPNADPHNLVSLTPAAQEQISDFMEPDGTVVDTCSGAPCHIIGATSP
jgi:hypothetical protein